MTKYLLGLVLSVSFLTLPQNGLAQTQTARTPEQICEQPPAHRENLIVLCAIWRGDAQSKQSLVNFSDQEQMKKASSGCRATPGQNITQEISSCLETAAANFCTSRAYGGRQGHTISTPISTTPGTRFDLTSVTCFY